MAPARQTLWEPDAEVNTLEILAPDWSPDGSVDRDVFERSAASATLTIVNVAEQDHANVVSPSRQHRPPSLDAGRKGLLVPLDTLIADRAQIWYIAYPSGAASRFTNDLTDYSRFHFDRTADGKTLAIVSESPVFNLEVVDPATGSLPSAHHGREREEGCGR